MSVRFPDAPVFWRLGADEAPRGPHVALVPGADAPLLALDLPDGLRGLARERVAQRQLAEALARPLDALELRPFLAPGQKGQWSRMLAIEAAVTAGWRKQMRPGCIAMIPDYLALPCALGAWTIDTSAGTGTVSVRLGPEDGFSAEPDLALYLLPRAQAPQAVLRLGPPEPAIDSYLETLKIPVVDDVAALIKAGLPRPLRWAEATGGLDLKAPASALYDRLGQSLARWRWPAIFGVLALAMGLGNQALETTRLRSEADRAATLTLDLVREHFVPSGPILDVRAQVQTVVDAAALPVAVRQAVPPLVLFQQAAPILMRDALRLQVVEYRPESGLVAGVTADDFASLDGLVADLRARGFLVEVLDSRSQQSGGIAARLRLIAEPKS